MGIKMTQQDIEVLTLVNRCGSISNEQARRIYGTETKLYQKRLVKLSSNHLISRGGGYIEITEKGSEILNQDKRVRIKRWERPYRAAMAQLVFDLPGWKVEFGTEIKRRIDINRGSKIGAVITKGEISYAIYQLIAEDPKEDRIGLIWNELQEMPSKGPDRAVIIYKTKAAVEAMFEKVKITDPIMKSIFLVGSGENISVLDRYHSGGFKKLLLQRFPGLVYSNRRLAQYKWKDDYVSVQVFPDAVKMKSLHSYYTGLGYKSEKRLVNIVCTTSSTYEELRELFPLAKYHLLDSDLTRFMHQNQHCLP